MLGGVLTWILDSLGLAGSCLLALVVLLLVFLPGGRPKNFPPGLPMVPILGSLPFTNGPIKRSLINSLRKKYGDLASFGILHKRIVLVSNLKTIKEVFSQAKTAGRPALFIITVRNNLLTNGRHSSLGILGSSGELWHDQRRFVLRHLRDLGFGKTSLEPLMTLEIKELMDHITLQKDEPIVMQRFFNRSIINVIWAMVMGKRYSYDDAKLATLLKTFVAPADINFLSPLHFLPGALHFAPYLPGLKQDVKPFTHVANFIKSEVEEFKRDENAKNSDCLTALYMREIEEHKGEDSFFHLDQLICVIFEMFVAGSETTSSTLTMAVYLLAKHPEIQKRVHEELDRVVGRDQLPSFSQMDQLPYTLATIHEVQRTFKLVPFSLPHSVMEDVTVNGYNIPKGTILIANMEDCLKDPALWRNPDDFDPRNFLDDEGKYKRNEAFMPFGSGKRQCVGEPLARLELFLFFACVMQRFHFHDVVEEPTRNDNPLFSATPKYTVKAKARF
ncbi:cytochrome P450 2C15-like [Penaeus japonicus]|uniref:cytochrome P450 2C15-like n=1 Tax=Penaeus japonicus TaxID=27405 RepID=UPI001C70CAAB|nr:cytochrome P450 2C15-like [Penaeus japonicus]XP_042882709.1 cytochrome P450 2C15-like [Penaeus japonicus]